MLNGIITKSFCGYYHVTSSNRIYLAKPRGKIKRTALLVGDRVIIEPVNTDEAVIETVLPRTHILPKNQAANIDQVALVQSITNPALSLHLLDQFLISINMLSIPILIVMTKYDLDSCGIADSLKFLSDIGYPLFFTSSVTNHGLSELRTAFADRITLLIGPSGVGKSTLINALHPILDLKTGDLSKINRGKHTTRFVELLALDTTTFIIDGPGFSDIALPLLPEQLLSHFPEFNHLATNCRFSNCRHINEPDCAIKLAVNNQQIALSRYQSYIKIYENIKEHRQWTLNKK